MVDNHPQARVLMMPKPTKADTDFALTDAEALSRMTYRDSARLDIPLTDPSAMVGIAAQLRELADTIDATMRMKQYNRYRRVGMIGRAVWQTGQALKDLPVQAIFRKDING